MIWFQDRIINKNMGQPFEEYDIVASIYNRRSYRIDINRSNMLNEKSVLITGGTGSFGKNSWRQSFVIILK